MMGGGVPISVVTLRVRVWIETVARNHEDRAGWCHPPREGVD